MISEAAASKRSEILLNIDDDDENSALRVNDWKLLNGEFIPFYQNELDLQH